ncbi:MAG: ABC transporter permease [Gammaproteobacteria bacterium]
MCLKRDLISLQTIVRKEAFRFFRLWIQTLLPPAITSTLYLVIFGNFIGSQIPLTEGYTYLEFIVPGLIMMSVLNNAYSNVVSSFFGAKFGRHIEEILVSPTPSFVILTGFVFGGVLRGCVVGAIIWLIARLFTPLPLAHPFLMISVVFLTALLFSLAGLINAIFAQKFDDITIVPTFVLVPLTYLGGVFYSIDRLPAVWQHISMANPILYMIDLFRYSFLGVSDVPVVLGLSILCSLTLVFGLIAYGLLVKGVGIRS